MSSPSTVKTLVTAWFSGDEAARGTYLSGSERIFREHGLTGATLYRSDAALVGDLTPHAVVMLEWKDAESCRAAFASPEYAELKGARDRAFERLDVTLLAE